ncbi:hypothetical protein E2562_012029 [Oryza meyeriana var. granulata]|uniref:Uncharacterized protein n=1 Tax=Oryza meyeriana var. granulata TaxID=110450 RepID=A0A6G1D2F2_9ORYZ|nr:hypothetical protein E2562_012029 [Oryza meyeriana var. granulata]
MTTRLWGGRYDDDDKATGSVTALGRRGQTRQARGRTAVLVDREEEEKRKVVPRLTNSSSSVPPPSTRRKEKTAAATRALDDGGGTANGITTMRRQRTRGAQQQGDGVSTCVKDKKALALLFIEEGDREPGEEGSPEVAKWIMLMKSVMPK